MIIYIHGFGSSGLGGKASLFSECFSENIILPSLSYVPTLAIDTLEQLIKLLLSKKEQLSLIGSSLGGYYAMYLASKYHLKAVLINPAITPYKTLDKIGMATNYYDLTSFEVTQEHIDALKGFEVDVIENQNNFMVLLQKDDDVLDYKDAVNKLPHAFLHIEEGGSHTFDGIERYFEKIEYFFNNS